MYLAEHDSTVVDKLEAVDDEDGEGLALAVVKMVLSETDDALSAVEEECSCSCSSETCMRASSCSTISLIISGLGGCCLTSCRISADKSSAMASTQRARASVQERAYRR